MAPAKPALEPCESLPAVVMRWPGEKEPEGFITDEFPLADVMTPEHLTEVLRGGGALVDGRVIDVTAEARRTTLLSHIARLRLAYDGACTGIRSAAAVWRCRCCAAITTR